jgi:hypothetical protein
MSSTDNLQGASMHMERFPTREAAEAHLQMLGYVFMGAPSRWRRLDPGCSTYVDVVLCQGAWIALNHGPRGVAVTPHVWLASNAPRRRKAQGSTSFLPGMSEPVGFEWN